MHELQACRELSPFSPTKVVASRKNKNTIVRVQSGTAGSEQRGQVFYYHTIPDILSPLWLGPSD